MSKSRRAGPQLKQNIEAACICDKKQQIHGLECALAAACANPDYAVAHAKTVRLLRLESRAESTMHAETSNVSSLSSVASPGADEDVAFLKRLLAAKEEECRQHRRELHRLRVLSAAALEHIAGARKRVELNPKDALDNVEDILEGRGLEAYFEDPDEGRRGNLADRSQATCSDAAAGDMTTTESAQWYSPSQHFRRDEVVELAATLLDPSTQDMSMTHA